MDWDAATLLAAGHVVAAIYLSVEYFGGRYLARSKHMPKKEREMWSELARRAPIALAMIVASYFIFFIILPLF